MTLICNYNVPNISPITLNQFCLSAFPSNAFLSSGLFLTVFFFIWLASPE